MCCTHTYVYVYVYIYTHIQTNKHNTYMYRHIPETCLKLHGADISFLLSLRANGFGFLKMASSDDFLSKETVSAFSLCRKRSCILSNIRPASSSLGEGGGGGGGKREG